jgi:hypothetical protein
MVEVKAVGQEQRAEHQLQAAEHRALEADLAPAQWPALAARPFATSQPNAAWCARVQMIALHQRHFVMPWPHQLAHVTAAATQSIAHSQWNAILAVTPVLPSMAVLVEEMCR